MFIIFIFLFQTASWIPFLCAVGLFVYQTLDAIDGKQVRNLPEKVGPVQSKYFLMESKEKLASIYQFDYYYPD